MSSFRDQLDESQRAHATIHALEARVRAQVAEAFEAWERGEESAQTIRYRLERIVRAAYRSAASVAVAHTSSQSEIPGWRPVGVFNTDYLQGLLADVRRNLRAYKAGPKNDVTRRRAISRIEHSAGVGATRGYTDATLETNRELKDFGFLVRKLWLANFVNNQPCDFCVELHGTEVPLEESFPTDQNKLKVYGDLKGPPRHPRCFVAGTEVTGPAVSAASQRLYKGEFIELTFGEGRVLTGTPNHPILTTKGWLALKDIIQGDQLVYDRRAEPSSPGPLLARHSNDGERPTRIEDVLEALSRAPGVVTTEVPSTSPDFHGDGTEGEVNVIHTNGPLGSDFDLALSEPSNNLTLLRGDVSSPVLLDPQSPGAQELIASRNATHGSMSGIREGLPAFDPFSTHANVRSLGSGSRSHILFEKELGNHTARYAQTLSEREDALAFQMSSDDLRSLGLHTVDSTRHFEDSRLVYNLETEGGWYTANGIIAHNCKCRLAILHVSLENIFERLNVDDIQDEATDTMTTSEIKSLPGNVFRRIVSGLKNIARWARGRSS